MEKVKIVADKNAHIENISWYVSVQNNQSYVSVSFKNLGYGLITGIKFSAVGYNSFGDIVRVADSDRFLLMIQDLRIDPNKNADLPPLLLPKNDIRKLTLQEWQICYDDGTVVQYLGKDEITVETEWLNDVYDTYSLAAVRNILSENINYIPKETDDGWLCACGRFNKKGNAVCSQCGKEKNEIFLLKNSDYVENAVSQYKKGLKKKTNKANKRRIIRNFIIILAVILSFALAGFIVYRVQISGRKTFSSAEEMRNAVKGTYTHYSIGEASRQIIISDDTITERYKYLEDDSEWNIKEWDYSNGVIKSVSEYIVTSDGNILDGKNLYKRGGYMSKSDISFPSGSSYESGSTALKITANTVHSNSSYAYCTGSVKNTGNKTYKFIKVKGAFKDSDGNVIDTDWTYAAGSEGLAPGESTTFRISVDNNFRIKSCSVTLLDYDE